MTFGDMEKTVFGWKLDGGRIPVPLGEDALWLVDEDSVVELNGPAAQVAGLLSETKLEAELQAAAETIPDLHEWLGRLEQAGLAARATDARQVRLDATGLTFGGAVAWRSLTRVGAEPLLQLLQASGVRVDDHADHVLVTTDDYLSEGVLAIARSETRPWMLARPVGRTMLLGPVFRAGGPCWFCLAHWLRTRRWRQASVVGWDDESCPGQPAVAAAPSTTVTAAGLLTTAVLRWLHGATGLNGQFSCVDLIRGTEARYELVPRAGCTCSPPVSVPLAAWTNPLTGLIFDLRRTVEPVAGIWQARARLFRPLPLPGKRPLLRPDDVYGAGVTAEEAETRCMAEGLERYSLIWRGDEPVVHARANELNGFIAPNDLTLFSSRQYRERDDWNQRYAALFHVAEEINWSEPIDWVEARSLRGDSGRYVPAASVYMWHTTPTGVNFGVADSNGCAAGRTWEEAVLGGLLELIERDAVTIWWYNRLRRPRVDWADFGDPWLLGAAEALAQQQRSPVLLDLTHDLGIPVYAAVAAREDGSQPYAGCAAHLDARTAARKALSELVQNWFWSSSGAGVEAQNAWVRNANRHTHPFLQPEGQAAPGPVFDGPAAKGIGLCRERLGGRGLEAFTVDLTREEIGIPVARVVAPGLRHCWMRFAPGRLFEVPLALGWMASAPSEDELNPEGCPL